MSQKGKVTIRGAENPKSFRREKLGERGIRGDHSLFREEGPSHSVGKGNETKKKESSVGGDHD